MSVWCMFLCREGFWGIGTWGELITNFWEDGKVELDCVWYGNQLMLNFMYSRSQSIIFFIRWRKYGFTEFLMVPHCITIFFHLRQFYRCLHNKITINSPKLLFKLSYTSYVIKYFNHSPKNKYSTNKII